MDERTGFMLADGLKQQDVYEVLDAVKQGVDLTQPVEIDGKKYPSAVHNLMSWDWNLNGKDFPALSKILVAAVKQGFHPDKPLEMKYAKNTSDNGEMLYSNYIAYCARNEAVNFSTIADLFPNKDIYSACEIRNGKVLPILHAFNFLTYNDGEASIVNKNIEYLLNRNYQVNKKCGNGFTALAYAHHQKNLTTEILLLKHGANPYSKSPIKKFKTIYDSIFDKDGNYYDFPYMRLKEDEKQENPEYKKYTRLLEQRLKIIRDFCKPELKDLPITPHNEVLATWERVTAIKEKIADGKNITEQRKQTREQNIDPLADKCNKYETPDPKFGIEDFFIEDDETEQRQHWKKYQKILKNKYPDKYDLILKKKQQSQQK